MPCGINPTKSDSEHTPPSSQRPPATTVISDALPVVATTSLAARTSVHLDITLKHVGWWTRFLLWIG
ncbi:uncharacterized protein BJ212DRAFT_1353393 [Suillus subaureus]|uniref:Uncharacterized protein n=1 Tax=Suillus subaureus TaxID=48587 RepID=A0A9P7DP05_9AGAM|nr:uncharacterized protein BJ212DRAFT_1402000 [Suillus subaureus]XP_041193371.1 uncharacterized protein BJ212DRAFT_1353393 [Suillus subaureus]KAG1799555.1 hypothetical protein BJ212DRAFT_1402000 [Suillus subaureus]KAG1816811.1 hypothetical protein BJ212DRAFT_1353393 [Suillus subaureus]